MKLQEHMNIGGVCMMRKGIMVSFILLLISTILISHPSHASLGNARYFGVNDERLTFPDTAPETHSGIAFVPVRPLAQAMNLTLGANDGQVTLSKGTTVIKLNASDNKAIVDQGKEVKLWMFTRDGRLMVPFAYITQYFGYKLTTLADGTLARATNSEAKLSNDKFVEKHKALVKKEESERKLPIYITFDDGPTAHTKELLDILKKYNAKATFFMLGNNMGKHPDELKRLVAEGHSAGLHGMTHVKEKFYKSPDSALKEMNDARDKLNKLTGVETSLIRSPYGSKPYLTQSYRDKLAKEGYHLWDWNVDSLDWKHPRNPQAIYDGVVSAVNKLKKQGTTPVILMHDQATTVSILPKLLERLEAEGYRFEALTKDMEPLNFWKDKR